MAWNCRNWNWCFGTNVHSFFIVAGTELTLKFPHKITE